MFAPHCPTCERRVLLGLGRIVHLGAGPAGGHVVVLRCRCGGLVSWSSQGPKDETPSVTAEAVPAQPTLAAASAHG